MGAARSVRCLVGGFDLDGWEVVDLLFRQVEPDAVVDSRDGTDRDRNLFAAPEVAFLEEHVRHPAIRGDDEALYPPDVAVGDVLSIAGRGLPMAATVVDLPFVGRS